MIHRMSYGFQWGEDLHYKRYWEHAAGQVWIATISIDMGYLNLKDNLPHNTYQIYVKPHLKNTQMTLEYQIFDEKALE